MADSTLTLSNSPALNRLQTILEPLLNSASGRAVTQHISLLLENIESISHAKENAFIDLFRELLDILDTYAVSDSLLYTHLQLLRMHIGQPLSATELNQLRSLLRDASRHRSMNIAPPLRDQIDTSLDGLIKQYQPPITDDKLDEPLISTDTIKAPDIDADTEVETNTVDGSNNLRTDQAYRRHLDDKRIKIQKIQKNLAEQVDAIIKQNGEFGVLLEVEHESLRQTESLNEIHGLRSTLIEEVEKLLKGNYSLANKLDKAKNYLGLIETEGKHLNDELTRVHILSLTDDLTGLANRRAFMRRMEDEVSRVQRYGSPLSLALIDLDSFKSVNDNYGHPAGDDVLRTFANSILSIIRHHDMVARYGGEEFAILLPNTDIEGATRALQKVQELNAQSHFKYEGKSMTMPTFSAGLALYKPGETSSNLIERTDKALYQAKDLGKNRIELAVNDQQSVSNKR